MFIFVYIHIYIYIYTYIYIYMAARRWGGGGTINIDEGLKKSEMFRTLSKISKVFCFWVFLKKKL